MCPTPGCSKRFTSGSGLNHHQAKERRMAARIVSGCERERNEKKVKEEGLGTIMEEASPSVMVTG